MAYLQTTATSAADVLSTLATFAAQVGYTVSRNNTFSGSGLSRRVVTLKHAVGDYAHIYTTGVAATSTSIISTRSISVALAADAIAQPERSPEATAELLSPGPYAKLWLFGQSGAAPYIYMVLEIAAGRYRHFGFGEVNKLGTWTGGSFNYGQSWVQGAGQSSAPGHANNTKPFSGDSTAPNGGLHCEQVTSANHSFVGVDQRYCPLTQTNNARRADTGLTDGTGFNYTARTQGIPGAGVSLYNQRAHLGRIVFSVFDNGGFWRLAGEVPGARTVSVAPFQDAEEFSIGSDVWKVFPLVRRGTLSNQESSGDYGLAYRKVT